MSDRGNAWGAVDWEALRRRLESAARMTESGFSRSPEASRALLEERARALARPEASPAPDDAREMLAFRVGDLTYAIAATTVLEAFRLVELSALPGAKPPATAITMWRGEVLMLLDLRDVPASPPSAPASRASVIVVDGASGPVGLLAEELLGITTIRESQIETLPAGRAAAHHVRGVSRDAVVILDARRLAVRES